MYRCYLTTVVGGVTATADVTDSLTNWDDVTLSYKREGLGAVMRAFSTQFEFAEGAYSALLAAFLADGVRAVASVRFEVRDAVTYTYGTLFECALDFSTLRYDGYIASINAVDNTIAGKLKSQRTQRYQYAVSALTGQDVTYSHLPMLNTVGYTFGGYVDEDTQTTYAMVYAKNGGQACYTNVKLLQTSSEIAVRGTSTFNDVPYDAGVTTDLEKKVYPLFTAQVDCTVTVRMNFTLDAPTTPYPSATVSILQLVLAKLQTDADGVKTLSVLSTTDVSAGAVFNTADDYALNEGDALCLYVLVTASDKTSFDLPVKDFTELSVTYEARDLRTLKIRTVTPVSLMQQLVDSICGVGNVTAQISSADDRVTHCRLMAAESIRGLADAQIYSSWGDFCDFMDAQFGCVPVIDEAGSKVVFEARASVVYDYTSAVQHTFTGDDAQEVEVGVGSDMLASKVSIGYEKQDYDSVNGRDEWRWTAEYKTGIEVSDAEEQLICPYRADVYGIEFLTLTRAEQTTDKDADEDIFLADCDTVGGVFKMRTDVPVTGIIAVNAMPNARYSQRYMALAGAFTLARLAQSLTFTSIGGNKDAEVGGVVVTADISLAGYQHLMPYEVSFATTDQTRYDWRKRLAVTHGGHTYTGWVKDVRFGVGRDTTVRYTLLVNQIA